MKIISPHTHKSTPVTDWWAIEQDSNAMLDILNRGHFPGPNPDGLAIHHSQVSIKPKDFFVLHRSLTDTGILPSVVINAELVHAVDPQKWQEACLSFPFRGRVNTRRYWNIVIRYDTPTSLIGKGPKQEMALDGLLAIVVQHELDHSRGIDIFSKFK